MLSAFLSDAEDFPRHVGIDCTRVDEESAFRRLLGRKIGDYYDEVNIMCHRVIFTISEL